MDVVEHATAMGGEIVATEHLQPLAPAHGLLADEGEQVAGNAAGIFAYAADGVGPTGFK